MNFQLFFILFHKAESEGSGKRQRLSHCYLQTSPESLWEARGGGAHGEWGMGSRFSVLLPSEQLSSVSSTRWGHTLSWKDVVCDLNMSKKYGHSSSGLGENPSQ